MRIVLLLISAVAGFQAAYAQTVFLEIPEIYDYRASRVTILDSLKTKLYLDEPDFLDFQFRMSESKNDLLDNRVITSGTFESPVLQRAPYTTKPDYLNGYKKYSRGKDSKGAIIGTTIFNVLNSWYQNKNSGYK